MSDTLMSHWRLASTALFASLLVACAQAPTAPPPSSGVRPTTPPAPPAQADVAAPPAPSAPVTVATQQQAQRMALSAVTMLELGHEDPARVELQKVLGIDPNNKLALNLMRQITLDPVVTLGRESFNYTVRPNDSMSAIAGRFMGDIYSFYILARYNAIAIPRQVGEGHVLRIPGRAPPPSALREPTPRFEMPTAPLSAPPVVQAAPPPPPPPGEPTPGERAMRTAVTTERSGDLDRARIEYQRAATLEQPGASAKADQLGKQLIIRYTLNARTAFAKQDLDGAIKAWDRVLTVDPASDTAKFERHRAMALKEKAKKL